jgi:myo-inositol 2-dehydrogenase / D-chiro-inositol 1-dehydrogenase
MTRICLIGAGRAGQFHFNSIKRNKNIVLTCIIDKNNDNFKKIDPGNKFPHIDNVDKALTEPNLTCMFDSVIIATPTQTHYELVIKCLNAGKHVFCEKPLGNSYQINECFQLAETKEIKLAIGFQKRFDKNYSEFINILTKENNKHITFITRDHPLPSIEYLKTSNGIVEDMLSHDIDISNIIMKNEKPSKVIAFANTTLPKLQEINEIEDISVMMFYNSGTTINIHGSRTAKYGYDQRAEAYTGDYIVSMNNKLNSDVQITTSDGNKTDLINHSFPIRYKNAYYTELDSFVKLLKFNEININHFPTCKEMLLNMEICDAINKSLQKNEVVHLS